MSLACITGDDAQAEQLIAEARGLKIGVSLIVKDPTRPTTVKNRIIAGRQHLLRIDREGRTPVSGEVLREFTKQTAAAAATADAVLLSDYRKGLLNETVCAEIIRAAGKHPVLVDPKGPRLGAIQGASPSSSPTGKKRNPTLVRAILMCSDCGTPPTIKSAKRQRTSCAADPGSRT